MLFVLCGMRPITGRTANSSGGFLCSDHPDSIAFGKVQSPYQSLCDGIRG